MRIINDNLDELLMNQDAGTIGIKRKEISRAKTESVTELRACSSSHLLPKLVGVHSARAQFLNGSFVLLGKVFLCQIPFRFEGA